MHLIDAAWTTYVLIVFGINLYLLLQLHATLILARANPKLISTRLSPWFSLERTLIWLYFAYYQWGLSTLHQSSLCANIYVLCKPEGKLKTRIEKDTTF